MAINIHAGKRVLYKNGNSGWLIGDIMEGNAEVNSTGVFIPIIPHGTNADEEYHWAEINNLFLDAEELNQNLKMYPEYYMSKEDYLNSIIHEAEHIKQAMLKAYDVDDIGEPPAYTIGYLVMKMYEVFKIFICDC